MHSKASPTDHTETDCSALCNKRLGQKVSLYGLVLAPHRNHCLDETQLLTRQCPTRHPCGSTCRVESSLPFPGGKVKTLAAHANRETRLRASRDKTRPSADFASIATADRLIEQPIFLSTYYFYESKSSVEIDALRWRHYSMLPDRSLA